MRKTGRKFLGGKIKMNTYETLLQRRSIRKYLKDPVPMDTLKKIMTAAIWAPSGSNSQPWRFYVAVGKKRDELLDAMIKASGPDAPSVEAYGKLVERVEKARENLSGENTEETGIRRMSEDGAKFIRFGSLRFYQAPVMILVAAPKQFGRASHQSIGAAIQNILLAAHAEGLATCWLGMPLMYGDTIMDILNIPEDEVLVASISLGYPDKTSPINKLVMPRMPFEKAVHLISE
jgi:nitroreductase